MDFYNNADTSGIRRVYSNDNDDITTKSYRKLWRGVIYQLFWGYYRVPKTDNQHEHYQEAVNFLKYNSEQLDKICFLANINPEYLLEKMGKVRSAIDMGLVSNVHNENKMQFTLDKILRRITGFYA